MRNPVVSILLTIFLLGSVSLLFIAKKDNNNLYSDLNVTRANADSLSKEKESLGNTLKKIRGKNDSLTSKSSELGKSLSLTRNRLAAKERDIAKINKTTDETNKKYEDLLAVHKEWEKESKNLKDANAALGRENESLKNKVLLLTDDNNKLNEQLTITKTTAKDNILIEPMTRSGKLNLKGKKVRKIVASLNLQNEMKSPTFRIFNPNGIQLPEQNGSFNLKRINETSMNSQVNNNSNKIELTYSVSKKIGPGLYRIEMLNENKHVGNLCIRFR
jgi:uncharacterized protein YhaN